MMKRIENEVLKMVAKQADPGIIINIPGCIYLFHQPKRPDSLRKDVICKKESK